MKGYTLPDGFLVEEEKYGHTVTLKTKRLWAVEIGCYLEFKRICDKYSLRYYASGGTLLGAVRHHGFIPWDDDMDVAMPEEDYGIFCAVAPNEVSAPFFFQNYMTEPGFGPGMSRIRNSDSTACTEFESSIRTTDYNCGVFLDIFPLFGIEKRFFPRLWQKIKVNALRLLIAGYEKDRALALHNNVGNRFLMLPVIFLWRIISLFSNHDKISTKYLSACSSAKKYDKIGLLSFSSFNERFIWPKEWFSDVLVLPFEFVEIACPSDYDKVLRKTYGDYKVFRKGGSIHRMIKCDPDVPYTISFK